MLYIPGNDDYLKLLTDGEVKDFGVICSFAEYFNSTKEKFYSKLNEEQAVELLYIFLTTTGEIQKYVEMMQSSYCDNCLSHYNFELWIFNLFDL